MKAEPNPIVSKMYENDPFSKWLGIERLEEAPGYCKLRLKVRREMLNGFGIAHGGICYSLADSALAFASNAHGRQAVSIDTSISHTAALQEGDHITAVASEEHLSHKLGIYRVEIRSESGELAALFKGIVYRKKQRW